MVCCFDYLMHACVVLVVGVVLVRHVLVHLLEVDGGGFPAVLLAVRLKVVVASEMMMLPLERRWVVVAVAVGGGTVFVPV